MGIEINYNRKKELGFMLKKGSAMLSKTHIHAGIAAALAFATTYEAISPLGVISALAGGTAGAVLVDIECRAQNSSHDPAYGRLIALSIVAAAIIADLLLKAGLCLSALNQSRVYTLSGAALLLTVCVLGRFSAHRTFTHSVLYVALISAGFYLFCPAAWIYVLLGGVSHLILDTMNNKPVPWLYPAFKKGVCLNLCATDKIANKALMWFFLLFDLTLLARAVWVLTHSAPV